MNDEGHRGAKSWPWAATLLTVTVAGLVVGAVAYGVGARHGATLAWTATTVVGAVAAGWWVVQGVRHGRLGVDVIALLALVGALIVHEELAGAVISVMLATGRTLEDWAAGRARRELQSLLRRAPSEAHVHRGDGLDTVALDMVAPGDLILVRSGEVVPVDGTVVRARRRARRDRR